jgi:hypothetical protein
MSNSPEYICNSKKIILLWSPKVACTTLHNWFVRDICEVPGLEDPRVLANKNNIPKNLNVMEIKEKYNDYQVYFFIRDPIYRCISCFINKFIFYRNEKLKHMSQLEGFSFNLIKNFDETINDGITFDEYLDAIENGIKIRKINHHFSPQVNVTKFLAHQNNKKLKIQNIENLNEKLNIINNEFNLPSKLYGKSNCSPYKKNIPFKDITNIKCFNINLEDLSIENFKNSFDKIKKIYENDYKFIGDYI